MPTQFKVGDKVQVLTWEEMLSIGEHYAGRRAVAFWGMVRGSRTVGRQLFIENMRSSIGKVFTIKTVQPIETGLGEQRIGDVSQTGSTDHYPLTNFMVKYAISKYPTNRGRYGH